MPIVNEIQAKIDDTPGMLARIASTLGSARVNILGILVTGDGGRFYVDDPTKALSTLKNAAIPAWTVPVLAVDLENTPGTLGRAAIAFTERGINVNYVYCGTSEAPSPVTVIFGVSDIAAAAEVENELS